MALGGTRALQAAAAAIPDNPTPAPAEPEALELPKAPVVRARTQLVEAPVAVGGYVRMQNGKPIQVSGFTRKQSVREERASMLKGLYKTAFDTIKEIF